MDRALNEADGFDAPWGPRTAERGHPCYNYTKWQSVTRPAGPNGNIAGRHDDNWNGPSWPFETAKMLTGYAGLLNDYPRPVQQAANASAQNFALWLRRYVYSHTRAAVVNGSAAEGKNGTVPWVGENLHPDDGYWLSRYLRFEQNCSGGVTEKNPKTGVDVQNWDYCDLDELYNHSSFVDLIISAMIGLRAAIGGLLTINPLVDLKQTKYFAVDSLRYKGHNVAVAFDRDGVGRYSGCKKGLCLWVDGKLAASRPELGKLEYKL